jgi:HEAT repeat protein
VTKCGKCHSHAPAVRGTFVSVSGGAHSKVHEPGVRSWLLQALRSTDWTIRAAAARALANYPEPDVAAALTGSLSDSEYLVRHWATCSLRSVGNESSIQGLKTLTRLDHSRVERENARSAIEVITARTK